MSMSQEENVMQPGGVESISSPYLNDGEAKNEGASKPTGDDVVASHNLPPPASTPPEDKANVEDDSGSNEKEEGGVNKGEQEDSESDSEDDLQIIVNDEDIYYPHGTGNEGGQEGEGEEIFAVGGEEHYEDMDWMAEMHSYHSQFFKYVRPGTGPGEPSPGAPDGSGPFPSNYPVGMWDYSFETAYEFILPPSQTIFDIDIDQFEEKPWDYPGVDMSDYFNFGFTEDTWKQYCEEFARAKEAYLASKMRDYEDGQGWNFDNGESEPVRLRNHGHRRNMRSIQMEGGGNERRDMRRQRLRDLQDGRSNEHHGDRRRQRNDDMQRRKGYSRTEQASSLGGRLSRTPSLPQTSPGGTFSSPSRDRRSGFYTPRSRVPSPGSAQNAGNGYRRHTMDSTSRPWQRSSRKHEFEDESYGSSDTDRHESEDEQLSARNHRLRRFSSQPLEKRLGARAEPPTDEVKSAPEKRVVRLSRYAMEEDEKKTVSSEPPRRLPPRIDRSPASANRAAEKRASRELVTENRMIQITRKFNQATETRAAPVSEKRAKDSTKPEAIIERKSEPAPERKLQSISERRAQFIAERKAAEKREKLLAEKRESAFELEAEKITIPVKVLEKATAEEVVVLKDKSGESQDEMKSNKSVSVVKVEERVDPVKDKDLRMQVIERVCSRWKFHIRRGDTRAKKKKHSMDSEGLGNEDAGKSESPNSSYPEKVEHGEAIARTREERKRTYREKQRQYDDDEEGYDDGADYDQPSERWQMDDVRERRSSLGYSGTKRRYNDENGLVEAWAVDEPAYEGAEDNNRWNGDQARRKRRKFNYNLIEEEHYADAEMGDSFNYNSRGRLYDGSTSSVQADDISYRRRGNSYSRKSDRWTGSLYDSGGEYDE